jgi:hypothetical protein
LPRYCRSRQEGTGELEERPAAFRLGVAEVTRVVDPRDVEQALFHPVIEPRTPEDELAQPVDERLAVDEGDSLPVAHEVEAEPAARIPDPAVRDELDQIGGLVLVEIVRPDQIEPHRRSGHALLEVVRVELEPVAEELDDEVVSRAIVGRKHAFQGI